MQVGGVSIEVVRKKIKNMHLYVLPPDGNVRISAPVKVSSETIRLFALTNIGWIKSKITAFESQPRQTVWEYISGESHYLWGKPCRLKVIEYARTHNVSIQSELLVMKTRGKTETAERKAILNEWYRKELKGKIPCLISLWQRRIGVTVDSWQVKNMRTKWGSCNVRARRIWLNLQLAKKPVECLEYIIVHELCHLIYRNHSQDFTALLTKHLPNWRDVQKLLNS